MAVVTAKEYFSNLFRIQDENPPSLALLLPSSERTYFIDLNTRSLPKVPEILGVERDHESEVIYFVTNRYFDYMDLTETVCLIKYINADNESHYYAVPFYDIHTPNQDREIEADDNAESQFNPHAELMMFPWVINGSVVKKAGPVSFSFNFYKVDDEGEGRLIYSLSTVPAKSKVLRGIEEEKFDPSYYDPKLVPYETLVARIKDIEDAWAAGMYWLKAE